MYIKEVGFPGGSVVQNPPANAGDAGDTGSILGRGHSYPLQYPCPNKSTDGGDWWAVVRGLAGSDTTE